MSILLLLLLHLARLFASMHLMSAGAEFYVVNEQLSGGTDQLFIQAAILLLMLGIFNA